MAKGKSADVSGNTYYFDVVTFHAFRKKKMIKEGFQEEMATICLQYVTSCTCFVKLIFLTQSRSHFKSC